MKNQFIFWVALWIFSLLVQVRGQNPNAAGSSCGGVLELSSGTLAFSPKGQDFCMWVIKLPLNSQKIQFQLTQIPEGSKLNLYSQDGHTAGQFSILPIASLTNADINFTVDTNSSSLIAIWTPSSVKNDNQKEDAREESSGLLSFRWDESSAQSQNLNGEEEIQTKALNLVGGLSYVEADAGRFSWEKPGKSQQTLLWVLNSKSPEPLDLKIETEFEKCDLEDPCLCSYFGVYEVYENFLRVVSDECGRSSNFQVKGIRPRLVALGFVNPEFRRDTNHVTLSWKGEEPEEGTTTTTDAPTSTTQTTTTQTTTPEKPTTTEITTEEPTTTTTEEPTPPTTTEEPSTTTEEPKTCSSGFPKSCSEIQFESASNSSELQNCVIFPDGPDGGSVEVLCDFEVDGGGWTIFQKRTSGPKEEFKQNWTEYQNGFGSVDGNFWLGLDNIHALTQNGDQELRIDLEDFEGEKKYAKYSSFSISDASDFYRLRIGGFSGDSTLNDSMVYNNGQKFSTADKDNDNHPSLNCAGIRGGGGWWFPDGCGWCNLNGLYYEKGETVPSAQGIYWWSWKGWDYSMAKSEMKIRKRKP